MFRGWRGKFLAGFLAFAAVTVFAPSNRAEAHYYDGYGGYGYGPAYRPGYGYGYGYGYYNGPRYSVVPRSYYYSSGYYGYGPSYYRGGWYGYGRGYYGYHHHGYYHGGRRW
jgi:hypothetical protein